MRNRTLVLICIIFINTLSIFISSLYAWTGDPWSSISRQTILKIADEMIDFTWSPRTTISNWSNGSIWYTFSAGKSYMGEAYSQNNPQENWAEFYNLVNNTAGGNTYYGNDCSGFVSISWKLPARYTTTSFESDAISDGGYVASLGAVGSGKNAGLLLGDAFVASGSHIIIFEYYLPDGSGIKAMEQTPPSAKRSDWTWKKLASYRPIRRDKIDEGNYEFKTKWGTQGNLNGQFNRTTDVAVDSSGNVFVVDSGNNRIQKFNSNGGFITKWGYYANVLNPSGGSFVAPYTIAIDTSGYVYVLDVGGGYYCKTTRIQKFDNNGLFLSSWGECGWRVYQFEGPNGFTVDSSGNVYVCDSWMPNPNSDPTMHYDGIKKFSNSGDFITVWGGVYNLSGPFWGTHRIAIDRYGNFYISEGNPASGSRITKYNSSFSSITKWGSCCLCDTCPGIYFSVPMGIAVDAPGNVYVADTGNNRIQKFDSNGNFLTKWGAYGFPYGQHEENGNFQHPEGIAVDSSLNVYVADTYNDRIQKFAPVSKLPPGPSNLAATAISSSQINLSWQDNSNNETGFKINRKNGINGTYSTIATVGANVTSYTDSGRIAGTHYYYAVWAYNDAGDSAYSNEVSASVGPKPDIKANGSDGPISVSRSTPVNLTISLDSCGLSNNADWWGARYDIKRNIWSYYVFSSGQWTTEAVPAYQGGLFNLSPLSVFCSTLSPGTYTFYFVVDLSMNGAIDYTQSFYDSVTVTVH